MNPHHLTHHPALLTRRTVLASAGLAVPAWAQAAAPVRGGTVVTALVSGVVISAPGPITTVPAWAQAGTARPADASTVRRVSKAG